MIRRSDWESRLAREVANGHRRRFAWGAFDCALFAADCVRAMTDVDPAADWRGRYDSASGAVAVLPRGLLVAVANAARRLGMEEIPTAFAGRGDLALLRTDAGLALGIVAGAWTLLPAPARGLAATPTLDAWKTLRV